MFAASAVAVVVFTTAAVAVFAVAAVLAAVALAVFVADVAVLAAAAVADAVVAIVIVAVGRAGWYGVMQRVAAKNLLFCIDLTMSCNGDKLRLGLGFTGDIKVLG